MSALKITSLAQLSKDIKRDIMFHIILNMRRYELTTQDAKYIAQDVLSLFPSVTIEELLGKIQKLGEVYKEIRVVYIKYAVNYYKEKENAMLRLARTYIKRNEIEKALETLKGGIYHD